MAILIKVPRLGWSMDQGTFGEWLFSHGEQVKQGDMLFVLEGDKSSQDIESFDAGILHIPPSAPNPGDKVFVGQPLGFLLAEGETAPALPDFNGKPDQEPKTKQKFSSRPAGPATRRLARELGINLDEIATNDPSGRVTPVDLQSVAATKGRTISRQVASPRARRKASELGISLGSLTGSGKNGRIREQDVIVAGKAKVSDFVPVAQGTWVTPTRLRSTIASRLKASQSQCVPVTLHSKVNASHLVELRQLLKTQSPEDTPGYNDILIAYAAQTLAKNPDLNRCWCNDRLYQFDDVNIGFAVDTQQGLIVPVIEQADKKELAEIAARARELVRRARNDRLSERELSVGTFTISNLGMFGIDQFTPIVNLPQGAILGIGRIVAEPIVFEGQLIAGKTISFSLTFDHRAIDGAPAARWLQQFCDLVAGKQPS